MGFFNECSYIIRKSNKDMILINSDNRLYYQYFKNSNLKVNSEYITNFPIDFSNYYFDIDSSDNLYGIFLDNKINILKFNNYNFTKFRTIDYDFKNYNISFPFIKFIDNKIHIFYYLTNKNYPITILFHHYNNGNLWYENKIDFINLPILDNFTVYFNQSTPTIFYLKENNGFPQVYCSKFNLENLMWDKPICITNSLENKIYLAVLKDKLNFYHISYCESFKYKYNIKYLNGYLNNQSFNVNINKLLFKDSLYLYPSLLKYNNSLFLSYIYKNILYTCYSKDLGVNWSNPFEDTLSINDKFIRSFFKTNYNPDKNYISTNVFITKSPFGILGNFNNQL